MNMLHMYLYVYSYLHFLKNFLILSTKNAPIVHFFSLCLGEKERKGERK